MKINHADNTDQHTNAIRGGARDFKTLLRGEEDFPGNYKLSFVKQSGELDIPRHRHNFDQIRMCLEGEPQNYGKDKWIRAGELVYFPEGTPYGPEQSNSHRLSITLQLGSLSGSGYIGSGRTQTAIEEMKSAGSFNKGVFVRHGDLAPGQKRNQDSYEAIWEHVKGRKLEYPAPRHDEPVHINPAAFDWQAEPEHPGVSKKALATFSERGCSISILKLDAGADVPIEPRAAEQVGFVLKGEGELDGAEIKKYSAFSISAAEHCAVTAKSPMEVLLVGLPLI